MHNDCQEPQAERVVDKERANFCEFFQRRKTGAESSSVDAAAKAKEEFERLFRRK